MDTIIQHVNARAVQAALWFHAFMNIPYMDGYLFGALITGGVIGIPYATKKYSGLLDAPPPGTATDDDVVEDEQQALDDIQTGVELSAPLPPAPNVPGPLIWGHPNTISYTPGKSWNQALTLRQPVLPTQANPWPFLTGFLVFVICLTWLLWRCSCGRQNNAAAADDDGGNAHDVPVNNATQDTKTQAPAPAVLRVNLTLNDEPRDSRVEIAPTLPTSAATPTNSSTLPSAQVIKLQQQLEQSISARYSLADQVRVTEELQNANNEETAALRAQLEQADESTSDSESVKSTSSKNAATSARETLIRAETAEAQNQNPEKQVADLQHEVTTLSSQLAEEVKRISDSESATHATSERERRLQEEVDRERNLKSAADGQLERQQTCDTERNTELSRLRKEKSELQQQLNDAEAKIKDLKKDLDKDGTVIEDLRAQQEEYQERIRDLKGQLEARTIQQDHTDEENKKIKADIEAARKELKDRQTKLDDFEALKRRQEGDTEYSAALQTEIANLKAEVDTLRKQLEDRQGKLDDCEPKSKQQAEQLEEAKAKQRETASPRAQSASSDAERNEAIDSIPAAETETEVKSTGKDITEESPQEPEPATAETQGGVPTELSATAQPQDNTATKRVTAELQASNTGRNPTSAFPNKTTDITNVGSSQTPDSEPAKELAKTPGPDDKEAIPMQNSSNARGAKQDEIKAVGQAPAPTSNTSPGSAVTSAPAKRDLNNSELPHRISGRAFLPGGSKKKDNRPVVPKLDLRQHLGRTSELPNTLRTGISSSTSQPSRVSTPASTTGTAPNSPVGAPLGPTGRNTCELCGTTFNDSEKWSFRKDHLSQCRAWKDEWKPQNYVTGDFNPKFPPHWNNPRTWRPDRDPDWLVTARKVQKDRDSKMKTSFFVEGVDETNFLTNGVEWEKGKAEWAKREKEKKDAEEEAKKQAEKDTASGRKPRRWDEDEDDNSFVPDTPRWIKSQRTGDEQSNSRTDDDKPEQSDKTTKMSKTEQGKGIAQNTGPSSAPLTPVTIHTPTGGVTLMLNGGNPLAPMPPKIPQTDHDNASSSRPQTEGSPTQTPKSPTAPAHTPKKWSLPGTNPYDRAQPTGGAAPSRPPPTPSVLPGPLTIVLPEPRGPGGLIGTPRNPQSGGQNEGRGGLSSNGTPGLGGSRYAPPQSTNGTSPASSPAYRSQPGTPTRGRGGRGNDRGGRVSQPGTPAGRGGRGNNGGGRGGGSRGGQGGRRGEESPAASLLDSVKKDGKKRE
jgi:hypothetical protein